MNNKEKSGTGYEQRFITGLYTQINPKDRKIFGLRRWDEKSVCPSGYRVRNSARRIRY